MITIIIVVQKPLAVNLLTCVLCNLWYNSAVSSGRSSVGRTPPCQGEGHEFESRRPLSSRKPQPGGRALHLLVFCDGLELPPGYRSPPLSPPNPNHRHVSQVCRPGHARDDRRAGDDDHRRSHSPVARLLARKMVRPHVDADLRHDLHVDRDLPPFRHLGHATGAILPLESRMAEVAAAVGFGKARERRQLTECRSSV